MKQSAALVKKKPIKSPILNFEHPIPIKLSYKSVNKEEKNHTPINKLHKSSIFNTKKNMTRIVNSKSKASQNNDQSLKNSESEYLSQQSLLVTLSKNSYDISKANKNQRSLIQDQPIKKSNQRRKYNIVTSNRGQAMVNNYKQSEYLIPNSKNNLNLKEDTFSIDRVNNSVRGRILESKQFNPFATVYKTSSKKHINKRFRSVENEENMNSTNVCFDNPNTESTFRDIYKINKINIIDYQKIVKNQSPQHSGLDKFYQFRNHKKYNQQVSFVEKYDVNQEAKPLQNHSQQQNDCQQQPKEEFQPYHKQYNEFEVSNKNSPSNRKKRLIMGQIAQQKFDMQINTKGCCVRHLRKKQNSKMQRRWFQNITTGHHEDFILQGWKQQSTQLHL